MPALLPVERIENRILLIRGEKVLLDTDLSRDLAGRIGLFKVAICDLKGRAGPAP